LARAENIFNIFLNTMNRSEFFPSFMFFKEVFRGFRVRSKAPLKPFCKKALITAISQPFAFLEQTQQSSPILHTGISYYFLSFQNFEG
jgi:hypothetical protein